MWFSIKKTKVLNPSYNIGLDFLDCFEMANSILQQDFMTCLAIKDKCIERNRPSYTRLKIVLYFTFIFSSSRHSSE